MASRIFVCDRPRPDEEIGPCEEIVKRECEETVKRENYTIRKEWTRQQRGETTEEACKAKAKEFFASGENVGQSQVEVTVETVEE